jgi:hypothetical protein
MLGTMLQNLVSWNWKTRHFVFIVAENVLLLFEEGNSHIQTP